MFCNLFQHKAKFRKINQFWLVTYTISSAMQWTVYSIPELISFRESSISKNDSHIKWFVKTFGSMQRMMVRTTLMNHHKFSLLIFGVKTFALIKWMVQEWISFDTMHLTKRLCVRSEQSGEKFFAPHSVWRIGNARHFFLDGNENFLPFGISECNNLISLI